MQAMLTDYKARVQTLNVISAPIFLEWRSAPAPALKKGVPLPHRSFWKKGVALFYRSFQKKTNLSKKLQTREFFIFYNEKIL